MTTLQNVDFLSGLIGAPSLDWLLDGLSGQPVGIRAVVVDAAADFLRSRLQEADRPAEFAVEDLCIFIPELGASMLNYLRRQVAGPIDLISGPELDRDETLKAVTALACIEYGHLLLPPSTFGIRVDSRDPAFSNFLQAVRNDPSMPSSDPELAVPALDGFHDSGMASSLIQAAWELARLDYETPSLEQLVLKLKAVLQQTRDAFAGKTIVAKAMASLSGIVLDPNVEIRAPWGKIRAARESEHPSVVSRLAAHKTVGATGDNGEQVMISDAGDVIVEVDIPTRIIFRKNGPWYDMSTRPAVDLGRILLEARLALLLSWDRDPFAVVPVWQRFIDPIISAGRLVFWQDPQALAPRSPIHLSEIDCMRWSNWIHMTHDAKLKKLGVAPTRLLRAVAERRSSDDVLVDAVIAWEAVFGEDIEITFKVSLSIARLLAQATAERREVRKRAVGVYRMRSAVVHGADIAPDELEKSKADAIGLGIEILRRILSDRKDLIEMTSSERILTLALE